MKVGIVTFQRTNNFGGALQCYALYTTLKNMGYDVEVVDYKNPNVDRMYTILPRMRKNILKWLEEFIRRIKRRETIRKRQKAFSLLYDTMDFSIEYSLKKLLKVGLDYDVIFAGSDQIWNSKITFGMDKVYLLDIPGKFKRCSYAVSLGNLRNEDFQTDYFHKAVGSFDKLSVRETNACDFIHELTAKDVTNCVDPTLLLDANDWNNISNGNYSKYENQYVFLYYMRYDIELLKIAKYFSNQLGISIVCFSNTPTSDQGIRWVCDAGPQDFLDAIKYARMIVTSSFHASVFSAIFEKELYIIPHPETGDRVVSLSQICGFESRVFMNFQEFQKKYKELGKISYNKIRLEVEVEKSKDYIKSCMNML